MNAYCERASLAMATVRFRFDGQAINELDTPDTLEMEEGDTIEVYQQQTGGFKLKLNSFKHSDNFHECSVPKMNLYYSPSFRESNHASWTVNSNVL